MKKEDFIEHYGEEAYKKLQRQRDEWRTLHPKATKMYNQEVNRKGGKYYEEKLKYQTTGITGEKHSIRRGHGNMWRPYKNIIAPDSQIHHQWVHNTSEYTGVALVEADLHMHGYIDVIEILEGKITLFREEYIGGMQ